MTRAGRALLVIRHAKAEGFAEDDSIRALTARGRRDAHEVGRWLKANDLVPQHAFVSPVRRTRQTWESIAAGSGSVATPDFDEALYTASPETVLEIVRLTPAAAGVVAFVGHNPTVAFVAHLLDDGSPDPAAYRQMSRGYPTAGTTVLDVPMPWAELELSTARITAFHVGLGANLDAGADLSGPEEQA